ncbi:hypothetical protein [Vulcanococcus limneticus]
MAEGIVTPHYTVAGSADHQPSFTIPQLKAPLVLFSTQASLIGWIA